MSLLYLLGVGGGLFGVLYGNYILCYTCVKTFWSYQKVYYLKIRSVENLLYVHGKNNEHIILILYREPVRVCNACYKKALGQKTSRASEVLLAGVTITHGGMLPKSQASFLPKKTAAGTASNKEKLPKSLYFLSL